MREQFPEMVIQIADGNSFFFVPGETERMFPFATLVQDNTYEVFSQLDRPGVYRLNIGVGKVRLRALFVESHISDLTALDTLMPHPTYATAGWVCILNPSLDTFGAVQTLLAGAYERSAKRAVKAHQTTAPDASS